jgi:hypothetical protein
MENDSIFADDKHANSSWFLLFAGQMSLLPLLVEAVGLNARQKLFDCWDSPSHLKIDTQ